MAFGLHGEGRVSKSMGLLFIWSEKKKSAQVKEQSRTPKLCMCVVSYSFIQQTRYFPGVS